MPRIPIATAVARRCISSPSQATTTTTASISISLTGIMRGKRMATSATAAASVLAMGSAHAPYQVTALAFVGGGGGVPPPPPSPSSTAHNGGASCRSGIRGRSYHSLAFHTNFHSNGRGGIHLHAAAAAATLDLSASSASASNEYLHTLSEADDDNNKNNNNANNNHDQSELKPQQQQPLPRPIVICGPSGVGKGTIINALLQKFPSDKFGFSVSHTTRQPRPGELNGTHYHFVTVDQIQTDIQKGKFLEYAEVHGNYYGTSVEAVQSVQSQGKLCILDIDVQGVQTIKSQNKLPDALYVFVAPPSVGNLEQRLRGRGTETEETLSRRLGNAQREMEYGYGEGNFDYVLVNGELDVAVDELADQMRGWYPTLEEDVQDKDEGGK